MSDENTPLVIYENDLPKELQLDENQTQQTLLQTAEVPVLVAPTPLELQKTKASVEAFISDYKMVKAINGKLQSVDALQASDVQAIAASASMLKKTNLYIPSVECYSSPEATAAATSGIFAAVESSTLQNLILTIKKWCRMIYAWATELMDKIKNREKKLKELLKNASAFKNTIEFKGSNHRFLVSFKKHKGTVKFDIVGNFIRSMTEFKDQIQPLTDISKQYSSPDVPQLVTMLLKVTNFFKDGQVFNEDYYGGKALVVSTTPKLHITKESTEYELDKTQTIDPLDQIKLVKFLIAMLGRVKEDVNVISKMATQLTNIPIDTEIDTGTGNITVFKDIMDVSDISYSISSTFTTILHGACDSIIKLTNEKG